MDNLISRQAAIDALGDMVMNWTDSDYELGQLNQWKADRKAIIDLPSAQPQRWIPVSERLPENGHYYLWCSNGGNVQSDYYWDGFENGQKYGYTIVAWMPLPEPYKGEEK